jgi:hypothetical protein
MELDKCASDILLVTQSRIIIYKLREFKTDIKNNKKLLIYLIDIAKTSFHFQGINTHLIKYRIITIHWYKWENINTYFTITIFI